MAEPPLSSLLQYHPQNESQTKNLADQSIIEQRRNRCFEYHVENAPLDAGPQYSGDEIMSQPQSLSRQQDSPRTARTLLRRTWAVSYVQRKFR